jgi:hypothetical protein
MLVANERAATLTNPEQHDVSKDDAIAQGAQDLSIHHGESLLCAAFAQQKAGLGIAQAGTDDRQAGVVLCSTDLGVELADELKVVLADIEHLDDLTTPARDIAPERWCYLAADLATLYGLAVRERAT